MSEEEFEKEFNDIQTTAFLTKEEILQAYRKLQQENKQLKSVLNEVREKVKEIQLHYQQYPTMIPSKKFNDLQEILDKVGGSNE